MSTIHDEILGARKAALCCVSTHEFLTRWNSRASWVKSLADAESFLQQWNDSARAHLAKLWRALRRLEWRRFSESPIRELIVLANEHYGTSYEGMFLTAHEDAIEFGEWCFGEVLFDIVDRPRYHRPHGLTWRDRRSTITMGAVWKNFEFFQQEWGESQETRAIEFNVQRESARAILLVQEHPELMNTEQPPAAKPRKRAGRPRSTKVHERNASIRAMYQTLPQSMGEMEKYRLLADKFGESIEVARKAATSPQTPRKKS